MKLRIQWPEAESLPLCLELIIRVGSAGVRKVYNPLGNLNALVCAMNKSVGVQFLVFDGRTPGATSDVAPKLRPQRETSSRTEWRYNLDRWAEDFVQTVISTQKTDGARRARALTGKAQATLVQQYRTAKRRALLLDYDGTLVPFADHPKPARPDTELMELLGALGMAARNEIVIVSGRPRRELEEWFGSLGVALIAEHGVWLRLRGGKWRMLRTITTDWKKRVRPILQVYADRLEGALLEEKEFSLAWHYRKADPKEASLRAKELLEELSGFTRNIDVEVLEGNKVLEVRSMGVSKGAAATEWLAGQKADFILAMGDDRTDEELFCALPPTAYSVRVGLAQTMARYRLASHTTVRRLLRELLEGPGEKDPPPARLGPKAGGAAKTNSGSSRSRKTVAARVAAKAPVLLLMAGCISEGAKRVM